MTKLTVWTSHCTDELAIALLALMFLVFLFVPSLAQGQSVRKPESVVPEDREHPFLFVSRQDLPEIMEKVEKYDWAKKGYEAILKAADRNMEDDLTPPPSTGRHSMVYMCPECGGLLKTLSETEHQCKDCDNIVSGMPYDAVLYKKQHSKLQNAFTNLGLASFFTGEDKYARKALDVLLQYADVYDGYPLVNPYGADHVNAGKIYDQTLNEAIWMVSAAWGYDLILGANVASEEEQRHVEENLLRPSVAIIRRYNRNMINNWQTWHNAGVLAAGLCLRDQEMIDHALLADGGYFYQLEHSLKEEGMQYEGSWSYHWYALHAFIKTAEMGYRAGIDTYQEPLYKALLLPLQVLMPDGRLPAIHDASSSTPSNLYYEFAAARFDEPAFDNFLSERGRHGTYGMLLGVEEVQASPQTLESVILNDSGLAVLRQKGNYAVVDFGEHGGGHGHYDKLNLIFFTQGQETVPDPGRFWPYAHRYQKEYYKRTVAHNTVAVDGLVQKEATGEIIEQQLGEDYDLIVARCDGAYEGVEMIRTIVMSDDWLVDRFDVQSATPHVYDWIWHVRGDAEIPEDATPTTIVGQDVAYKYLEDASAVERDESWQMTWGLKEGTLYGEFFSEEPEQVYFATSPDNCGKSTSAALIRRREATDTSFISVYGDSEDVLENLPKEIRKRLQ